MIDFIYGMDPLVFYSSVAVLSLIILSKSSDLLVVSISNYAKKLGVSDYLIGFIVVSIGTALPELVASINGAGLGEGGIVFGTILGSNLFKIPLLGFVLIAARKIKVGNTEFGVAPIVSLVVIVLPVLLIIDGRLDRIDGIVLLVAFFIYISRLWQKEGELGKMKKDVPFKKISKDGVTFLISLVALLLSGKILVISSLSVSKIIGISPYVVGLVIIGIGASMPELTVQLKSVFKHHKDLAFGNMFGSLLANSSLVLGITALIKPFSIGPRMVFLATIFLVLSLVYVFYLMGKSKVTWKHGLALIGVYLLYMLLEWIF